MSERIGMADGRCFTIYPSSQLLNDYVMTQHGIKYEDNYSYRQLLQKMGPDILKSTQKISGCAKCGKPVARVPANIF